MRKRGKEKKKKRKSPAHTKHDTGSGEKKIPGHDLWETILAIIYDFPGCVGAMPCTRGEGKRRAKISTSLLKFQQCQFLKRNQGGELVHIQIYVLRLDVKRVTYLSVGMKWSHCPMKGYKLG